VHSHGNEMGLDQQGDLRPRSELKKTRASAASNAGCWRKLDGKKSKKIRRSDPVRSALKASFGCSEGGKEGAEKG